LACQGELTHGEATLAAEADMADILHDVVVGIDDVVVLRLAANVVR
jgi:hypothetical protein